jgi:hypothetical protein
MFHIPSYFQIVFSHSVKTGWATPKAVSEGLSTILCPEVRSLMIDTFYNKFFRGTNKGRTLYSEIQEYLMDNSFTKYLYQMERDFTSVNYKGNKFDVTTVAKAILENIKETTNITGDIRSGLIRSYHLHGESRLYLFLSEALYYALELQHNKNAEYKELDSSIPPLSAVNEQAAWTRYIDEKTLYSASFSDRLIDALNLISEEEMNVFAQLAKLALIDEDEAPYLYAPVTDEEIALYEKYGIGNHEFLLMEECGVVNLGARVINTIDVTDDALYGFQNDNLVIAFTMQRGQRCTIEYKSYMFTSVGVQLLELIETDTDDGFFSELAELLKQKAHELSVKVMLLTVEEAEKLEDIPSMIF